MNKKTRCAIIGTAPSWIRCPWDDPGLYVASLNDAYTMEDAYGRPMPRADEWWDTHPFDKMWFRDPNKRTFHPNEIPEGVFVRPQGHIEWLKKQAETIPVWLKDDPPADWPVNAKRFPFEQIQEKYGLYWASGPAYMLAHLYDRGFRELHVYGIHLATQAEYLEQRSNWEFLLGRFLGSMEIKQSEKDGRRYYEGKEGLIVLPKETPILFHKWQYGYEPKPKPVDLEARKRIAAISGAMQSVSAQFTTLPWWKLLVTRRKVLKEMSRLNAKLRDAKQQAKHAQLSALEEG